MDLTTLKITTLSKMLNEKEISSFDLTKAFLDKIEKEDKEINSFITVCSESALSKAKKVDERRENGEKLSPLAGIPIGIKDNISTKDIKTTCASKMLENFVPFYNATVIENIIKNDMIILGKLNMDEFAMGSSCENSYFGRSKNPINKDYVTGGSSGGSAAAVASDLCPIALGSDTGGSIRQPASYCGIVGLKPTYGGVSRYGLVAFASSLDQIGPMGKSVKDVAMLSEILYSNDEKDSTSIKMESYNFLKDIDNDINGVKVAIPKEYFGEGINSEVSDSVKNVSDILKSKGAIVEEISMPMIHYALSTYYILSSAEASSNLARFDGVKYGFRSENFEDLDDLYFASRSEGFGKEVKRRIMLGTYVLSSGYYDAYYKKALESKKLIEKEYENVFKDYDVILTPTAPNTAFLAGSKTQNPKEMYLEDICTVSINIAGVPAISIPCGKGENGMPIGAQLISDKFMEAKLLNVANIIEKELKN